MKATLNKCSSQIHESFHTAKGFFLEKQNKRFTFNIYLNNVLKHLIKIRFMFLEHYNVFYIFINTQTIKMNLYIKSIQI